MLANLCKTVVLYKLALVAVIVAAFASLAPVAGAKPAEGPTPAENPAPTLNAATDTAASAATGATSSPAAADSVNIFGPGRAVQQPPLVAGSFLQPFANPHFPKPLLDWDQTRWDQEIQAMQSAGMHILVLQYTGYNGASIYPSALWPQATPGDQVDRLLRAADAAGFQVFLGLSLSDSWWRGRNDDEYLRGEALRLVLQAMELLTRYGAHPSFQGWYIPHEIVPMGAWREEPQRQRLADFLRQVTSGIRLFDRRRPIAIAPYFIPAALGPAPFKAWWAKTLQEAGVNIVMLQDGVGRDGHAATTSVDVPVYFRLMAEAARAAGVSLWADIEVYRETSPDPQWRATAGPWGQLQEQMQAVAPFVDRIVVFEFARFMSPLAPDPNARALYRQYVDYYHQTVAPGGMARIPDRSAGRE
ncbi:MAG: DUF4434 domain-containing protein [Firmicutes bacterium]|nr:DUF4434 domain-containing protein [Bacillota bacterium]